jgi:hypothetical protein
MKAFVSKTLLARKLASVVHVLVHFDVCVTCVFTPK